VVPDSPAGAQGDSAVMEPHLCRIESSLGRATPCPREFCPLWHGSMCVVAGLSADLATTPGLPELLLGIRERLADVSTDASLLPPGLR
jgi:hypothetical protein